MTILKIEWKKEQQQQQPQDQNLIEFQACIEIVVNEKSYAYTSLTNVFSFSFFFFLALCARVLLYLHTTTVAVQKYLKIIILFIWTRILFQICFLFEIFVCLLFSLSLSLFLFRKFLVIYTGSIVMTTTTIMMRRSKSNCIIQLICVVSDFAFVFVFFSFRLFKRSNSK